VALRGKGYEKKNEEMGWGKGQKGEGE